LYLEKGELRFAFFMSVRKLPGSLVRGCDMEANIIWLAWPQPLSAQRRDIHGSGSPPSQVQCCIQESSVESVEV